MARTIALSVPRFAASAQLVGALRSLIVCGCAAALILADRALPLLIQ